MRVVGYNILVFVSLFLIIEVIFGDWIFGPDLGSLNISVNSVRIDEDSPYYPAGSKVVYKRNEYGFRGEGAPEQVKVLVVGGSTSNDRVSDDRDMWTAVLQKSLRTSGWQGSVWNAGVDGHSTVGHIRSFEMWFPEVPNLKPDYYLFYVGINDRGVSEDDLPQPDSMTSPSFWRRITTYISNHSFFVQGFKRAKGLLAARNIGVVYGDLNFRENAPKYVESDINSEAYKADQKMLDSYHARLKVLHDIVKQNGAKDIYVTQPVGLVQKDRDKLKVIENSGADHVYWSMQDYNQVLMDHCHLVEAICIDLAGEIDFESHDFYDAVHTTPVGSKKIGEYLAQKLRGTIH